MKRRNQTPARFTLLLIAALAAPVFNAAAESFVWTNMTGGDLLWSNAANWTNTAGANGVPAVGDTVTFGNATGMTNAPGSVNNIVAANTTVTQMLYQTVFPGYQTTLINPGVALMVTNNPIIVREPFAYRGTTDSSVTGYVTIKGEGRLIVGDTNNPGVIAGNQIRIHQVASELVPGGGTGANTNGPFMATLDLSGLDYFACAPGELKVGASATSGRGTRGTLILAKTNLVIAGVTSDNFFGIIIGSAVGGNYQPGGSIGALQLGQQNDIRANSFKVGGARAQLGTMRFRSGLINPVVRMRNVDGVSPVGLISIGDNYQTSSSGGATSTSETSTGDLDLSGGTVDILVVALRVGRNLNSGTTGNNGSGNGTLTWTAGIINCNGTVDIGRQNDNNAGNCTGVVNVRSNAVLLAPDIRIGSDSGTATGTGNGTLNIVHGGQVGLTDGISEDIASIGSSTINLTNGTLTAGGNITVDTLNYSGGIISSGGALGLTNLVIRAPATAFTLQPGQRLAPGAVSNASPLKVSGGLVLSNATLHFDLSSVPASRDQLAVTGQLTLAGTNYIDFNIVSPLTNGSYTLATYGTLSGGAGNLQVGGLWAGSQYVFTFSTVGGSSLVVQVSGSSGVPQNLTWTGDGIANLWDLNSSSNWNGGAAKFFNNDTVTFTDSGSASPAINLVNTLLPASVTVNSGNNYSFAGNGKISGSGGLTKLGSGALNIFSTNDYTGATLINSGTVLVNGGLGNTTLNVARTATLGGNGIIRGFVIVQSGGRLSPGASIGTLSISNNLVLSAGCTNLFDVNTDTLDCDGVTGLSSVGYGGTLALNFTGSGTALTNGGALKLFNAASYTGGFATIIPASPGAGRAWDLSSLTNGMLRVVATVSVLTTNIVSRVNGNMMELSWPADHTGWRLESQTNAIGVGLTTNWYPVTGSLVTNWLSLPIDPAAGTVFYRLAYAPTMKELRKAAANRQRRVIFNNDGGEPARSMTEPTVQNLLELRTLGLEGTLVDSIFYTPRCSGFGLFTYFTTIGSIFTATGASYTNNMMGALLAAGIDPLRVMNEFAHSNGMEFFCSFRMNDTHDGAGNADAPVIFAANPLKVNHPEYLIGTSSAPPTYGEWTAVDYARPEIRDLAYRFAEEVCTNYNVDGIELDFFRHPVFFKSTGAGSAATVAERTAMTQLMQRIRTMADEVGRARGRPILISMRVPDSVAYCRAIGLELDTWLAGDLLDLLVVSSYYKLNDWDHSVALARQYGVKIYPSLDECRLSDATAKALRVTDLAYRGRAANLWGFGADGVYMFNFTDRLSPLWQQLGDPYLLSALDKDYFGTIRGAVNAAGGNLPYSSYQTIEKLNPSNTKTVTPGSAATARINVGEDLSQAGPVNLKFRLQFSTAVNPQLLSVTCNSQPLALSGTNQLWVEYSAAPSVVQQVTNHVRVTLSPSASQVVWRDLMLEVRH